MAAVIVNPTRTRHDRDRQPQQVGVDRQPAARRRRLVDAEANPPLTENEVHHAWLALVVGDGENRRAAHHVERFVHGLRGGAREEHDLARGRVTGDGQAAHDDRLSPDLLACDGAVENRAEGVVAHDANFEIAGGIRRIRRPLDERREAIEVGRLHRKLQRFCAEAPGSRR